VDSNFCSGWLVFFFLSFLGWGETESTWYVGQYFAYCTSPGWWMWSSRWNENWQGNRSTRRKPAPVLLCSPQMPHDLGSNPDHRGGKPATNRLSYGTVDCSFHRLFHVIVSVWRNDTLINWECFSKRMERTRKAAQNFVIAGPDSVGIFENISTLCLAKNELYVDWFQRVMKMSALLVGSGHNGCQFGNQNRIFFRC
jgi:hypothetical protein